MERTDNWTEGEDAALLDAVTNILRLGLPRTKAFEEIAHAYGRTYDAVRYRFYSRVKKDNEAEVAHAYRLYAQEVNRQRGRVL